MKRAGVEANATRNKEGPMSTNRVVGIVFFACLLTVVCRWLADLYPGLVAPPDPTIFWWATALLLPVAVSLRLWRWQNRREL